NFEGRPFPPIVGAPLEQEHVPVVLEGAPLGPLLCVVGQHGLDTCGWGQGVERAPGSLQPLEEPRLRRTGLHRLMPLLFTRTHKLSSGAGWLDVMPRKAVMAARSGAAA